MSRVLSMDLRRRWQSRSVTVTRWHDTGPKGVFKVGDVVCDLDIDGVHEAFFYQPPRDSADWAGPLRTFVQEGRQVSPWGSLLLYGAGNPGVKEWRRPHPSSTHRLPPLSRPPRVFLSYRRDDSAAYAGRIYERLVAEFGAEAIFLDDFSIPIGSPAAWVVQQAAAHCEAMIALIGPIWASIKNPAGALRLHSDRDLLRRELCAALDRGVPVLPLLAPKADAPQLEELPEDLRELADLQYFQLTSRHWPSDMDLLMQQVKNVLSDSGGR